MRCIQRRRARGERGPVLKTACHSRWGTRRNVQQPTANSRSAAETGLSEAKAMTEGNGSEFPTDEGKEALEPFLSN
jgi:hypothetical protein